MIELKSLKIEDKFKEYSGYVLDKGFVTDQENEEQVQRCIEIFKENKAGLIIVGNPGSGKTLFFEMMQRIINPQSPRNFLKLSVLDIVLQFNNKTIGHDVFRKYANRNVFFDDLGTEKQGYLFGEYTEVFEIFIQFRYELFRSKKLKTHFTTNLSTDQLLQRYGLRCASRLTEMCEKVYIGNKANYTDRRLLKNFISLPPVKHFNKATQEQDKLKESYEKIKAEAVSQPIQRPGLGQRLKQSIGIKKNVEEITGSKSESAGAPTNEASPQG